MGWYRNCPDLGADPGFDKAESKPMGRQRSLRERNRETAELLWSIVTILYTGVILVGLFSVIVPFTG
jgi:hypothetical protein